jgi:hypothetical protein
VILFRREHVEPILTDFDIDSVRYLKTHTRRLWECCRREMADSHTPEDERIRACDTTCTHPDNCLEPCPTPEDEKRSNDGEY